MVLRPPGPSIGVCCCNIRCIMFSFNENNSLKKKYLTYIILQNFPEFVGDFFPPHSTETAVFRKLKTIRICKENSEIRLLFSSVHNKSNTETAKMKLHIFITNWIRIDSGMRKKYLKRENLAGGNADGDSRGN